MKRNVPLIATKEINNFLKEINFKEFTKQDLLRYFSQNREIGRATIQKLIDNKLLSDYILIKRWGRHPAIYMTPNPIPLKRVEICYKNYLKAAKFYENKYRNRCKEKLSKGFQTNTPPTCSSRKGLLFYIKICLKWLIS